MLCVTQLAVLVFGIASSIPALAASIPREKFAYAWELHSPSLVFKVQVDAGTTPRNHQPLAPEQRPTDSETTGTLEGCIDSWDRDTHMTKDEWRNACKRVMDQRATKPKHD
jgi:hypothetical protein